MNRRKWTIGLAIGLGSLLVLAVAWAALPEQVTIEKCGEKKANVEFDHAAHVALESDCTKCHHNQEDLTADTGTGEKCRACHFEPKDEALDCSQMSTSKNPYHKLCVTCHKAAVAEDEASKAPTKCDNCHPKA